MPREVESRNVFGTLQTQQRELLVLAELSGLQADPAIYRSVELLNINFIYFIFCYYYIITRIIIELLNQQIDPDAIYKLLKYIRRSSKAGKQTSTSAIKRNT